MKYLNYFLIILGIALALYSDSFEDYNKKTTVLVLGMAAMMIGIYRISKKLRSRSDRDNSNASDDN
ncbi:hypothetical protein [Gaetbulibacter aestuarii]|uniref:LPXTG cell wall anchor domain-containing protein n=1 Tax=Gaetbulibacter aestuarii TaxID=1502358 RepID=A0ABW7MZS9_9FLAO